MSPFKKVDDYRDYVKRIQAMSKLVDETYRPKAPEAAGLASYPGGPHYYEFLIRSYIIHGASAQQIHALGLAEVKRLRPDIGAIAKEVGFKGTTDAFIEHMRTDPKYLFDSADAVLAAYRAMPARVDPQLPKLVARRK